MAKDSLNKIATEQILSRHARLTDCRGGFAFVARRKIPVGNQIYHQAFGLSIDQSTGFINPDGCHRMPTRALASEADLDYANLLSKFASEGYIPAESNTSRPIHICEDNWDLETNLPKAVYNFCKNAYSEMPSKMEKKAQTSNPASQWYSGKLPDPQSLMGYVGSSSVDASQLYAAFNGVNEAIQMVNQFDSSLLRNVAFIFNTSGGAYGVYVPWLDEQIKNTEVKNLLKRKGFEIDESDPNFFKAFSKDPKIGELDIKQEIQSVQSQVHMQGGNTFGINMAKIMSAAMADANESGITDPDEQRDIAILHLGSTMVHEAVHARGSKSEGPSEQLEAAFTKWALPILNKKRFEKKQNSANGEEFNPLVVNPNSRRSWYDREISKKIERTSQYGAQFSLLANPTETIAPWSGILWQPEMGSIEGMLQGRRQGLQPQKSFEKRLRDQSSNLPKIDHSEIAEMLLEKDHDQLIAYQSIESLLEDRRPKPLAIMIDKVASSKGFTKTANDSYNSTFGWMNNLDLPMAERIITEEHTDDFLNFDWKAMRKQPRYNPEYDRFGIYYRWNEPRMNSPELWNRMVSERGSTSPSLRFAEEKLNDSEISEIIEVLSSALRQTSSGKIAGTRFLCGTGILPWIDKFYSGTKGILVFSFPSIGKYRGEGIFPVWVVRSSIPEDVVTVAEAYASGKTDEPKASDIYEHITGLSKQRKKVIDTVLAVATELAQEMGLKDLFVLGAFPRAILSKESWANVFDLDFSSNKDCIKFGSLLAKRIGADTLQMARKSYTLLMDYKGLRCHFKGKCGSQKISELMTEDGIDLTPVNLDVYSRDFTINMFAYKVADGKIYDMSGQGAKDMQQGIIRTYFNADGVLKSKPIAILRAIKYACHYNFEISNDLQNAIKNNANLLISECDEYRLLLALIEIKREGSAKSKEMLSQLGLQGLSKIETHFDREDLI